LGDRVANLCAAVGRLREFFDVRALSPMYDTAPWGVVDQPRYMNAVLEAETDLEPEPVLAHLLAVEASLGRVRAARNGPRVIDLDLLLYGEREARAPGLTVPHPRLTERAFVLVPLAAIAPGLVVPGTRRTVEELLSDVDSSGVVLTSNSCSW
jgi:2-amino-4-hydroxy-6-hydroxymethyldihydropteridine diphosphokinase